MNPDFFPMVNHKAGGAIYQWTLGFNTSAYQAAAKFGHRDVLQIAHGSQPQGCEADRCLLASRRCHGRGPLRPEPRPGEFVVPSRTEPRSLMRLATTTCRRSP